MADITLTAQQTATLDTGGILTMQGTGSAPPPPTPAAKIVTYMSGLGTGTTKRVLSGQHADIWDQPLTSAAAAMGPITSLQSQTGKSPAILGLVLNFATNSYAVTVGVSDNCASQWFAKNGLVELSLYSNDPTFSYNSSGAPVGKAIPSAAFHTLANSTSAAYKQWHIQLDSYAAALATLTAGGNAVLFRPFIELNGQWNWYGGENAADMIAVWQDMHNYLNQVKGLAGSLVWNYNVNVGVGGYTSYYPGDAYVDIVSLDNYAPPATWVSNANIGNAYAELIALKKPFIFGECGLSSPTQAPNNNTVDNMTFINDIRASFPQAVGFMPFNGGWAICNQNNASALMSDPWIINVTDLPGA